MFLATAFVRRYVVYFIGLFLFLIPFFWFQPGAMDLGGDGTRLYFYDPISFLRNAASYSIAPDGKGSIDPAKHAYFGYVLFIAGIKYMIHSAGIVIGIFSGIKLSIVFLSIYFIVKEFIQRGRPREGRLDFINLSAILAGLFYIVATGSEKLIFHWISPLHSHDQVFLNPLVFFLLLRYLLTQNRWYLLSFLFISLIFSANFAMVAAPPLFAFYPLAIVFLFLYVTHIRKIKIPFGEILFSLFLFIGLHAFHLIPELSSLLANNTETTAVIFKESGVNYFNAIRGLGLATVNLFIPSAVTSLHWTSIVVPLILILGCFQSWKKNNEIYLTSLFFFITFFLVTANITTTGIKFYQSLFLIPGFAMFRNFYVQWAYVFIFFYALLFGQALSVIFRKIKPKYIKLVTIIFIAVFLLGFWPFLSGQLVDGIHWGSNGVKTAMVMDPRYERTLDFIRTLPDEGKMLVLPLTDNYIQVLFGTNNAAYTGPSTITFLTGKKSFAGYTNFWPDPIPEDIMRYAREGNFTALTQIFSIFNIRYIFYNTDPNIYEGKFPQFPNSYMMTSLPKTQSAYKEFVHNFPVTLIYSNGPYEIYELDKKVYRPEVYVPDSVIQSKGIQDISREGLSYKSGFIDKDACQGNRVLSDVCTQNFTTANVQLKTTKIDPTRYRIDVVQSESEAPFLLIFQNTFHPSWKLTIDKNSPISEKKHILVNAYANGWVISKDDRKGKTDYTVYLTLEIQRYFRYGVMITAFSSIIFLYLVLQTARIKKTV